jgi:RNA polymerase sigma-70 factor (ECF subfamily)
VVQDAAVREQDSDRVAEAYRLTHARLWRSVFAFSGSREITDDSVAEAFAQVLGRGEDVRDVVAWVWRTAFAIARGQLAARAGSTELASAETGDAVLPERAVELIETLARLQPRDRELIVLCHVGGWTPKELADIAGLPAATVRVRLHRATRRARNLFTEEELR